MLTPDDPPSPRGGGSFSLPCLQAMPYSSCSCPACIHRVKTLRRSFDPGNSALQLFRSLFPMNPTGTMQIQIRPCCFNSSFPGLPGPVPGLPRDDRRQRPAKKILKASRSKDCTLVLLVLQRFIGYRSYRILKHPSGRFSGSRVITYSPHLPITLPAQQWSKRISSPFTAAGPLPNLTGFPIELQST